MKQKVPKGTHVLSDDTYVGSGDQSLDYKVLTGQDLSVKESLESKQYRWGHLRSKVQKDEETGCCRPKIRLSKNLKTDTWFVSRAL